jgi:hypothetical protein
MTAYDWKYIGPRCGLVSLPRGYLSIATRMDGPFTSWLYSLHSVSDLGLEEHAIFAMMEALAAISLQYDTIRRDRWQDDQNGEGI